MEFVPVEEFAALLYFFWVTLLTHMVNWISRKWNCFHHIILIPNKVETNGSKQSCTHCNKKLLSYNYLTCEKRFWIKNKMASQTEKESRSKRLKSTRKCHRVKTKEQWFWLLIENDFKFTNKWCFAFWGD